MVYDTLAEFIVIIKRNILFSVLGVRGATMASTV
jgi:hypothetical protein